MSLFRHRRHLSTIFIDFSSSAHALSHHLVPDLYPHGPVASASPMDVPLLRGVPGPWGSFCCNFRTKHRNMLPSNCVFFLTPLLGNGVNYDC